MTRHCARPGCHQVAVATLTYDYRNSTAWLDELAGEPHPMTHDLCESHAAITTVPRGWELNDRRPLAASAVLPAPDHEPLADWPHLAAS